MKSLDWIPALELGDELLDSQHKHLFELYNRVLLVDGGHPNRQKLFLDLLDYVDTHFADEERLMESIGYPELEFHKGLHRQLVERVMFLKNSPDWEVLDFFQEWLFRHIMAQDHKIKVFMTSNRK